MEILVAVSISRPRADVSYCIHALSRRLAKTRSWIVALKTLIVIHRILREGDPSFREELLHYSHRGKLFQVSNFKDDSSALAWDCSAWVRSYALFLEERLECCRTLNYDIEADRAPKSAHGISKAYSKTRLLGSNDLLHQLPAVQQLLYRLICCQPEGAACYTFLVQYALSLALKESFKIYSAVNDGIINLVDMFFEMPRHDAVKALDIYKKAGKQAEHLADFYSFCRTLDLARTFQFPILRQPPPTFVVTMEEYIKEAPQVGSLSNKRLDYHEKEPEPEPIQEPPPKEEEQVEEDQGKEEAMIELQEEPEPEIKQEEPQHHDLLGLSEEVNPEAMKIEESNALALTILQPGENLSSPSNALAEIGKTSGWELALVTAPSNTNKQQTLPEVKMGGGFGNLLLDSLYEDEAARRVLQLQSAGYNTSYGSETTPLNPFNLQHDPFSSSNAIVPPTNVQMAMTAQQEHMIMMTMMQQQQQMAQVPYNPYMVQYDMHQHQPQQVAMNPFDNSFQYQYPQMNLHGHNPLI